MRPTNIEFGSVNRRLLLGTIALLLMLVAYLGFSVEPAHADHIDNPIASKTPNSIDFGDQQIGTNSSTRIVTVRNEHNGCASRFLGACFVPRFLQISGVALGGPNAGGFTIVGNNCSGATLNLGASCSISVRFNPTVAQAHNAFLTISSNGTIGGGNQVPLAGQGVNPTASPDPDSVGFGRQVVATTSAPRTVTITNTDAGTLVIGGASLDGANAGDFILRSPAFPVSLPEGASITFRVRFAPTVSGPRRASLVIDSNAADSPLTVPLAGSGVFNTAPRITAVRPVPNSSTRDRTPLIKATVRDAQTNLAKSNIRLFVDGRLIKTFRYNRATDKLTYTSRRLSFGRHSVKVVANDGQGLRKIKIWRFRVIR